MYAYMYIYVSICIIVCMYVCQELSIKCNDMFCYLSQEEGF